MPIKNPKPVDHYNEVQLFDAKPNKMFPDWMTERMRFLRYLKPVPCASCGRKSKHHWTMTISFKAVHFGKHIAVLKAAPDIHLPLTPVCRDHPLEPILPAHLAKSKPKKN